MSETNEEVTPEGRLMADLLRFRREHAQWPKTEEFRRSHAGELPLLDAFLEEESVSSTGKEGEQICYPTLKGILLHGRQIAREEIAVFDRVLPFLKEAYSRNPEKQWTAEEIGALAGIPGDEVSRSLDLLVPRMAITVWRIPRPGAGGQPPPQQMAEPRTSSSIACC